MNFIVSPLSYKVLNSSTKNILNSKNKIFQLNNFQSKASFCSYINRPGLSKKNDVIGRTFLVTKTQNNVFLTPKTFKNNFGKNQFGTNKWHRDFMKSKQNSFLCSKISQRMLSNRFPGVTRFIKSLTVGQKIFFGAVFIFIVVPVVWWTVKFLFKLAVFIALAGGAWFVYRKYFRSNSDKLEKQIKEAFTANTGSKNPASAFARITGIMPDGIQGFGVMMQEMGERPNVVKQHSLELVQKNSQIANVMGQHIKLGEFEKVNQTKGEESDEMKYDIEYEVVGLAGTARVIVSAKAGRFGKEVDYELLRVVLPNGKTVSIEEHETIEGT